MAIAPNDARIMIISLETALARRRLMAAQLEFPGLPDHEFVAAVDGRQLAGEQLDAIYDADLAARHDRALTPPEIGCAASHLEVYRRIVATHLPAALVLEDDALLGHQLPAVLGRVLATLDAAAPRIVLLSHVARYSKWGGGRLDKLHRLYRPYEAFGAHAYVITRAGAEAMLQAMRPIRTVADDWGHVMCERIARIDAVVPYAVGTAPAAGHSQIGSARYEPAAAVPPSLGRWLHKYLWKKFLFQLTVKPALRLTRQDSTW